MYIVTDKRKLFARFISFESCSYGVTYIEYNRLVIIYTLKKYEVLQWNTKQCIYHAFHQIKSYTFLLASFKIVI